MFLIVFASFGFLLLFPPSVTIFISLGINPSPALIIFGNSDVYYKGWKLSFHLVKLTNLVNAAIILLSKTTLLRWLTFLLGSLTVTLDNLALLDFFLSSDPSICSNVAFPPLKNSDHIVFSVSMNFF